MDYYHSCGYVIFLLGLHFTYGFEEYCSQEKFTPRCEQDEAIVIHHATYGRMRLGRCVTSDYGHIGCGVDVLPYMDSTCSGKSECEMSIPIPEQNLDLDCPKDLRSYLNASYGCQRVYQPKLNKCFGPYEVSVSGRQDYLSSKVSKETGCGFNNTPWVLKAQPGQQLSLTLVDFNWGQDVQENDKTTCSQRYGYIVNTDNDDIITICGGGPKRKLLYQSLGHSVQIVLDSMNEDEHHFLIQYEAIGCPDITPPSSTWMQKDNDSVTIGCINSEDRWHLKCVDNTWLGYIGNCTPALITDELPAEGSAKQSDGNSFSKNHVLMFSIGCGTLVVCCATIILGIYCSKRYDMRSRPSESSITPHYTYDDGTIAASPSTLFLRPTYMGDNTIPRANATGFHGGEFHSFTMRPSQMQNRPTMPPPLVPDRTTSLGRNKKANTLDHNQNSGNFYLPNQFQIQSNPVFEEGEPSYFLYDKPRRPRESTSSDTEQLYQSIRQSTSSSVVD